MTYDDWKTMTPEQDNQWRNCSNCGDAFDYDDLEPIDGLELCPECLESYETNKDEEYEPATI